MKNCLSLLLTAVFMLSFGCTGSQTSAPAGRSAPPAEAVDETRLSGKDVFAGEKTSEPEPVRTNLVEPAAAPPRFAARPHKEAMGMHGESLPAYQPESRESYDAVSENIFINTRQSPLSTFSVDVDTASYANVRRFLHGGQLPPRGAVRIEEMLNSFPYDYAKPTSSALGITAEVGPSPWHPDYGILRIGLQAAVPEELPPSNLVFLIDVSGSMDAPNKLPLLQRSMKLLVDRLQEDDRIAIVAYAGADHIALPPTGAANRDVIHRAIDTLSASGSTHASRGLVTAYDLAERHLIPSGNNRIILASDGDFNVGVTSRDELQRLIAGKRDKGIYLTVLGFGMGNYRDDVMELLADKGNGNYAYIDSLLEAQKVMGRELAGTLHAVARDVKIQVEFNPAAIGAYRLVGYENRRLANEEFSDDSRDAAEMGAGHQVTALYELIPAGHADIPHVDALRYQSVPNAGSAHDGELLNVKVRYRPLDQDESLLIEHGVGEKAATLSSTSDDFRFALAVATFAMKLRASAHVANMPPSAMLDLARNARGDDTWGYRAECIRLMEMAQLLGQ